ncbi:MAG: tetratricopeptide repeat protein [Candidatus Marinimicrobia bacterium]|nr:tetratricopeptide repeat protein [Candidatus Neomarinimicrobiota bacterium]
MIFKLLFAVSSILVIISFSTSPVLGQNKAANAFETEQYETAIEAWDKLLKEHPDLKGIHYNQGNAQFKLGQLDEAISAYEQALSVQDRDALADIYYNLGNSWLHKQDVDRAKEFYRQALRLRPGDIDAKANLELLNHMPPPPPQEQQSDQDQQENQEQQQDQDSQSKDQNDDQEKQDQQEQDQQEQDEPEENEQQNSEGDQEESEQQQEPQDSEVEPDQEALLNAQQLLDALKDRETENMREQIRLKTSGQDNEKDW